MSFPPAPLRVADPKVTEIPFYTDNLSYTLNMYRQGSQFCDIYVLTGDGRRFPAHRAVLAAASPYFRNLFRSSFMDSTGEHKLELMAGHTTKVVLNFIYTGCIALEFPLISELLAAAEFLLLPRLKEVCVSYLLHNMDLRHVCKV